MKFKKQNNKQMHAFLASLVLMAMLLINAKTGSAAIDDDGRQFSQDLENKSEIVHGVMVAKFKKTLSHQVTKTRKSSVKVNAFIS